MGDPAAKLPPGVSQRSADEAFAVEKLGSLYTAGNKKPEPGEEAFDDLTLTAEETYLLDVSGYVSAASSDTHDHPAHPRSSPSPLTGVTHPRRSTGHTPRRALTRRGGRRHRRSRGLVARPDSAPRAGRAGPEQGAERDRLL